MGNLKSDWGFSAPSLDLAAKDDHFALHICAADLTNEPSAAEALIKIKTCLAGAKIPVEVADIKFEPLRDGAKSTLQDIFVLTAEAPPLLATPIATLLQGGRPERSGLLFLKLLVAKLLPKASKMLQL